MLSKAAAREALHACEKLLRRAQCASCAVSGLACVKQLIPAVYGGRHAQQHQVRQTTMLTAGQEIEQLWLEYEQGSTPEAQLVKDFDKVLQKPAFPISQDSPAHHALDAALCSTFGVHIQSVRCDNCRLLTIVG